MNVKAVFFEYPKAFASLGYDDDHQLHEVLRRGGGGFRENFTLYSYFQRILINLKQLFSFSLYRIVVTNTA